MIVQDIYDEAKQQLGTSDQALIFRRITDAVEALNNKALNWDGLLGYADVCVDCTRTIALPPSVQTPISVNICGQPAVFHNRWYNFHLNGPGDCGPNCDWSWTDRGTSPVQQNIINPSQILVQSEYTVDNNAKVMIYGYERVEGWGERPVRTFGPEETLVGRYLTSSFVQPAALASVVINVSTSDGLNPNDELILVRDGTLISNYYPIIERPSSTTVRIKNLGGTNEAPGSVFGTTTTVFKMRTTQDGWQAPINNEYATIAANAPYFTRVTRINKPTTQGFIRITALDTGRQSGESKLAYMDPNETETRYRRITVSRACSYVRMQYRRENFQIRSLQDHIMTDSRLAVIYMMKALKFYDDNFAEQGQFFEDKALQWLSEKQNTNTPQDPVTLQVVYGTGLSAPGNFY